MTPDQLQEQYNKRMKSKKKAQGKFAVKDKWYSVKIKPTLSSAEWDYINGNKIMREQ